MAVFVFSRTSVLSIRTSSFDHSRSFLVVFVLGLVLALAVIVVLDPLDSGRFPSFTKGGPLDADGRVANVSRGRDARFNAAIIGNSHLMLLDPKRLSATTGLSFVQLAVPAERRVFRGLLDRLLQLLLQP